MPIEDKVAAAKKIDQLLKMLLSKGGFHLKYRITVDPPAIAGGDWARPDIAVDLSGPDGALLLERGGELLRAFEHIAVKMLRLESEEHDKISFDCMGRKALRLQELKMTASVAAERVRKTGMPYEFGPMPARERRALHLSLRNEDDLKTASQGEGGRRCVVVYPKDYKPAKSSPR